MNIPIRVLLKAVQNVVVADEKVVGVVIIPVVVPATVAAPPFIASPATEAITAVVKAFLGPVVESVSSTTELNCSFIIFLPRKSRCFTASSDSSSAAATSLIDCC